MNNTKQNNKPFSIAITGIGGVFPGAEGLNEFWQMIKNAQSAGDTVPKGRWPLEAQKYVSAEAGAPDKVFSARNCSIKNVPNDFEGLNIDKELVKQLDPLFAIALKAAKDAFFDSNTKNLDKSRVQVILANIALPTDTQSQITREACLNIIKKNLGMKADDKLFSAHPLNRLSAELPAALISAALGLSGGAYTLDAACASSLYSLKLACEELRANRADAVLAGGMSRPSSQFTQMGFTQLRALSKSGICRPFDKNSDGLVVGEGAGIFVLKRLNDAIRDKDNIYAVIRAIGLSNDVGGSLLAPDKNGQLRAMKQAYLQAGWAPNDVQLIECHGTGTAKGDSIEVESLKELWQGIETPQTKCVIGSVKSNVGHLLTGAASAGLIKLLFALKNKTLPPTYGFKEANPALNLENSPFTVLSEAQPWQTPKNNLPRRAAISAFGFGGIDAHVLLEEWICEKQTDTAPQKPLDSDFNTPDDVVITSIAARAGNISELNDLQKAFFNCKPPITTKHNPQNPYFKPWAEKGVYVDSVKIEPGRFKISPNEINQILPQQLLMLDVVDKALSLEGIKAPKEQTLNWGVFIGINQDMNASNFASRWSAEADLKELNLNCTQSELAQCIAPPLNNSRTVGALGGIVTSRIAREFNVGGPSHTFSSGDCSGLSALEAAYRALQRNEINTAIVGAVDLTGDFRSLEAINSLRPYAKNGETIPFDTTSNGALIGEGAVAIILKRKSDALKDGNKIYAEIKGISRASAAKFNDNQAKIDACKAAIQKAWQDSKLKIENIGLISCAASGCPKDDAIEAEAMLRAFPKKDNNPQNLFKNNDQLCALAASKAAIGYTGCASGLFALAEAALCLHQQMLPKFPALKNPVEQLKNRQDFFFAPNQPQYWLRNKEQGPRTAGVTAFSIEGSFCHVVLQAFEEEEKLSKQASELTRLSRVFPAISPKESIYIVAGHTCCDARERLSALRNMAESGYEGLAKDYWQNYKPFKNPKAIVSIVASDNNELAKLCQYAIEHLKKHEDKPIAQTPETKDKVFYNPAQYAKNGKICFAFSGSGNHFLGMGAELAATWPEFMRTLDKQYNLLAAQFAPRLTTPWLLCYPKNYQEEAMKRLINDHNSLVFGHVSCCALISDIVRSFNIEPNIIMGYSLGETAGNFATRTWRERDEMVKRMRRSNLFTTELINEYNSPRKFWNLPDGQKIEWLLGVIHSPASEVEKYLKDFDKAYILIVNTPNECVIGGEKTQVEALARAVGKAFFKLDGVSSVHCKAATPSAKAYRDLHLYDCFSPSEMQFISSAKAKIFVPEKNASADSIAAQCTGPINFVNCVETAYNNGARVFFEIGPRSSLTRMIDKILQDKPHTAKASMLMGRLQSSCILSLIAAAAAEGVEVDISSLFEEDIKTQCFESKLPPVVVSTAHPLNINAITELYNKPANINEAKKADDVKQTALNSAQSQQQNAANQTQKTAAPQNLQPKNSFLTQKAAANSSPAYKQPPKQTAKQQIQLECACQAPQQALAQKPLTAAAYQAPSSIIPNSFAANEGFAPNGFASEWLTAQKALASAHEEYLKLSSQTNTAYTAILERQLAILKGEAIFNKQTLPNFSVQSAGAAAAKPQSNKNRMPKPYKGTPFLDRNGSMEFAIGKIAKALGDFFKEIDNHPTRVRLPDVPLNFVDRIISVEGQKGSLGQGRVVTQHDVYPNAWYLDNYCMPTGLAVEAGQADLFLSAWLGIDFKTKGLAKYRLLDAVVTFHGPLPKPGDTINYDIRVNRFIRQADTYLFFFEFDGSIDGKHLITMRKGCAGFFTDKQLADGKGIVLTEDDIKPEPKANLINRNLLPKMKTEAFNDEALNALRQGDLEKAFGPDFANLQIKPQTIPSGKMQMLNRITQIEPEGGRFGLGRIKAEIDIPKDPWFLTQHFCDDQVMPGTLMYESCMQALRVFLLRMGWVDDADKCAFEPIINVQSRLKCRGQVIKGVKKALYDIEIKELGYNPEPYAIADALMFADGNRIVQVLNMSVKLTGSSKEKIEALWAARHSTATQQPQIAYAPKTYAQGQAYGQGQTYMQQQAYGQGQAYKQQQACEQVQAQALPANCLQAVNADIEALPALFTGKQILEYAIGRPSVCFGPEFKEFDDKRFLARLPNPPYLFVDRITAVNAEFKKIKTGGVVQGQFDIKPDAWFFRANRQTSMPFAVLLEFPLQVCGWFSCYMGSAMASQEALHYRNLDGTATLYEDINNTFGTVTATVKATKTANSAGMLIQSFDMLVTRQGKKIYEGSTTFGFFSETALANQVGLRGAKPYEPSESEKAKSISFNLPIEAPITPNDTNCGQINGLVLPGKALTMLDKIELFIPDGGPKGLGFLRGIKLVDKSEWFFKAHFYQDPVMPGSLGLEAFMLLLKAAAIHRWGKELSGANCHFEPIALNIKHTWSYRGQVIQTDRLMTVDACITSIDDAAHTIIADGFLKVDGRIIYSMKNFGLRCKTL